MNPNLSDAALEAGGKLYGRPSKSHAFTEAISVDSNSVLQLGAGLTSVNVSALSIAGDDTGETTFTPTLSFATPGDSTWVDNGSVGSYYRIGKRVFVDVYIGGTLTKGTGSSYLEMSGIPTPVLASSLLGPMGVVWADDALTLPAGATHVIAYVYPDVGKVGFAWNGDVATSYLVAADVGATLVFGAWNFSLNYTTP